MDNFPKHMDAAYRELQMARKLVNAEIRAYPSPISGCDAQFNHLLGERQKIAKALNALTTEIFVPTSRKPMSERELEQS